MKVLPIVLASMAVTAVSSPAATFLVTGGTTSVDLDDALLSTIGWSVLDAPGSVPPAAGFDVGYPILAGSTFSYEDIPFTIIGGDILHSGSVILSSDGSTVPAGNVTVGDFTITSGLQVIDTLSTGLALFAASPTAVDAGTPGSLIVSGDLEITDTLSTVLVGDTSLAGTDAGNFQVTATTIPEPGTTMLGALALLGLAMRRRRS